MQYFGFDRPSFGIKTFGFGESNSKLSADFTTGTYNSNGAAKTFADLFTFTRAGKAWLVKDTGLQEYAADVPRLDNGLLIEQSATNLAIHSNNPILWSTNAGLQFTSITGSPLGGGATVTTSALTIMTKIVQGITFNSRISLFIKNTTEGLGGDIKFLSMLRNDTKSLNSPAPYPKYYYNGTVEGASLVVGDKFDVLTYAPTSVEVAPLSESNIFRIYFSVNKAGSTTISPPESLEIHGIQVVNKIHTSSFIKTEATPVTRPADYLLNKITGTTITGDWDSTLNLSIVAGNLVHSGYGRIRSLEIN